MNSTNIRKYILVTISHSEKWKLEKKDIVNRVLKIIEEKNIKFIVVAKECHKKDGRHYHIAISNRLASRYLITDQIRGEFKEVTGRGLNVSFHKGENSMIKYVMKEDKNPELYKITLEEINRRLKAVKEKKMSGDLSEELRNCKTWDDVIQNKELAGKAMRSYTSLRNTWQDMRRIMRKEEVYERLILAANWLGGERVDEEKEKARQTIANLKDWQLDVMDWFIQNLLLPRTHKQPQLILIGPPNAGKSHYIERFGKIWISKIKPNRIDDWSGIDTADFYVWEEIPERITGEAAISLLRVLEGSNVILDSKYSQMINKTENIGVVLIGNMVPDFAERWLAFGVRLIKIDIPKEESLEKYSKEKENENTDFARAVYCRAEEYHEIEVWESFQAEKNNKKLDQTEKKMDIEKVLDEEGNQIIAFFREGRRLWNRREPEKSPVEDGDLKDKLKGEENLMEKEAQNEAEFERESQKQKAIGEDLILPFTTAAPEEEIRNIKEIEIPEVQKEKVFDLTDQNHGFKGGPTLGQDLTEKHQTLNVHGIRELKTATEIGSLTPFFYRGKRIMEVKASKSFKDELIIFVETELKKYLSSFNEGYFLDPLYETYFVRFTLFSFEKEAENEISFVDITTSLEEKPLEKEKGTTEEEENLKIISLNSQGDLESVPTALSFSNLEKEVIKEEKEIFIYQILEIDTLIKLTMYFNEKGENTGHFVEFS